MLKSFITRSISAVLMLATAIVVIILGQEVLLGVIMLLSLVGMFELYRVVGIHKSPLGIVGYVLAAAYYALLWFDKMQYIDYYCVACGIIVMFTYVCCFKSKKASQAAFALMYFRYFFPFSSVQSR